MSLCGPVHARIRKPVYNIFSGGKFSGVPQAGIARLRATLINLTLTIVALLFFSFFYEKLRKNRIKGALIYSRLNKSVLP
jgi:hypothetical protein